MSAERDPRRLQDRPVVPRADRATSSTIEGEGARARPAEDAGNLRMLKAMGFSDARLATLARLREASRAKRARKRSTCTRSTSASTPAPPNSPRPPPICIRPMRRLSPARSPTRRSPRTRKKVVILGGGPNRIGQGIEFDYCCCHACFALRDAGFETIMVNCNPETVSTDYDTSDRLYFEPLTAEDVLEILRRRAGERARCTASSCSSAARRR